MFERGIVSELDAATHRVQVRFAARGDLVSPWLDVLVPSTHGAKDFRLPAPGNQVVCLMNESGTEGYVLGALYSGADPVPGGAATGKRMLELGDGARFTYDADASRLTIDLPPGGQVALCGDDDALALAKKVKDEIDAFKAEYNGHGHPAGALVSAAPGSPVTGVTGAPAIPASATGDVGAAQVRSS